MLPFFGVLFLILFLRPAVLIGLWRCELLVRTAPLARATTLPTLLSAPVAMSATPLMVLYTNANGSMTPQVIPSMLFSRLKACLLGGGQLELTPSGGAAADGPVLRGELGHDNFRCREFR